MKTVRIYFFFGSGNMASLSFTFLVVHFFFTPWLFLRRIHNNNITFQFVFKAPQNGDDEVFLVILSFNIYVVKQTHFFFLFSSSRVPTIKRLFHFLSFLLIKKKGRGGKWPRPRQGESRSRRKQNYIFLFHCFFFLRFRVGGRKVLHLICGCNGSR